jgi:hypothetical protein
MPGTEHSQLVGQQVIERGNGLVDVPGCGTPSRDLTAGVEGMGMIRTRDPQPIRQQLLESGNGAADVAGFATPSVTIVTGGQSESMIRSELSPHVSQQCFRRDKRTSYLP